MYIHVPGTTCSTTCNVVHVPGRGAQDKYRTCTGAHVPRTTCYGNSNKQGGLVGVYTCTIGTCSTLTHVCCVCVVLHMCTTPVIIFLIYALHVCTQCTVAKRATASPFPLLKFS